MPDTLADQNAASRMREAIRMITREVIEDILPSPRYGTVTAVDATNRRCTLTYTDEPSNPITLPVTAVSPQVGSVVRISGKRGARYVDEVITGGVQVNLNGQYPAGLYIPASSDATSERAGVTLGDWQVAQDFNGNGPHDFFIWNPTTGLRLYLPAGAGSGLIVPTAVNGGWAFRLWPGNNAYNAIQTASMASGDYVLLSNGADTYLGSGTGGTTYIRGPSNSSTAQLSISSTLATFSGQLSVGGLITTNQNDIRFVSAADGNHWLGYRATYGGYSPNGPVLQGYAGGVLGTTLGGASLAWDSTQVICTRQLTMGGIIIPVGGEYLRASSGSYQTWYSGGTRTGYIQGNHGSSFIINSEQQPLLLYSSGTIQTNSSLGLANGAYLRAGGNTTGGTSGGNGGVMMTDGGANYFHTGWDGNMRFYIDASNVKTFVIEHPTRTEKYLVHAVAEGPTSDVFYRGKGQLVDGFATINIDLAHGMSPGTFEALTELEGRTVSVQPILNHAKLLALGPREIAGTANLACTEVENGQFHVSIASGMHVWDQVFHWQVWAVRKGTTFDVELDKATTVVAGDGPYTYVTGAAPSSAWPRQHSGQIETPVHPDATVKITPEFDGVQQGNPQPDIQSPEVVPEVVLTPAINLEHLSGRSDGEPVDSGTVN